MTPEQERTLEDVATLFPYLDFVERMDWVSRLKKWFDNDFSACTNDILDRSERITGKRWPGRLSNDLMEKLNNGR